MQEPREILDEIVARTRKRIESLRAGPAGTLDELKIEAVLTGGVRDFTTALSNDNPVNIIAEVKKASPSKGILCEDFDPVALARTYEQNGATAVSVITEEDFFLGSLKYLEDVKHAVAVPVLRKDFIVDESQVFESRAAGADAVLLIAAIVEPRVLEELVEVTLKLHMTPLVEVHTAAELEAVLGVSYFDRCVLGINNRDLATFSVDTETTLRLAPLVPPATVVVSESGINSAEDMRPLMKAGVKAFLVGEALVTDSDPGAKLRGLVEVGKG